MHQKPSQHKSKNDFKNVFNENSTLFRFKSDCLIVKKGHFEAEK